MPLAISMPQFYLINGHLPCENANFVVVAAATNWLIISAAKQNKEVTNLALSLGSVIVAVVSRVKQNKTNLELFSVLVTIVYLDCVKEKLVPG